MICIKIDYFVGQPEVPSIEEWLVSIMPPNSRVGMDPFLMLASEFQRITEYLESKGHKLVSVQQNLVDLVWKRPVLKTKPLEKLEYRFSGKRAGEKVEEVREAILKLDAECLIMTALDDIACKISNLLCVCVCRSIRSELMKRNVSIDVQLGLFNLRGSDIEANPVFFAYAILTLKELHLYVLNRNRINYDIENHFYVERIEVMVNEYNTTLAGINNVV